MRILRPNLHTLLVGGLIATSGILAACDQTDARLDRAVDLADAALEQMNGDPETTDGPAMDSVPVEARAFSGAMMAETIYERQVLPSRFAVGSIIAKPLELEIEESAVPISADPVIAEPPVLELNPDAPESDSEVAARAAPMMESLERIEIQPQNSQFADGAASSSVVAEETAEPAPERRAEMIAERREALKASRRAVPTPKTIVSQTDARSRMLDTMSKYGLAGSVELSTSGQMVIQIGEDGADPTQGTLASSSDEFRRPAAPRMAAAVPSLPALAWNTGEDCPSDISPDSVRGDPIMATNCVVAELRQSGAFAYVEKDFIFDHQFARRPAGPIVTGIASPNDPLYDLQWHFRSNGSGEDQSAGGAGFEDFWTKQATQGSDEVVVAVVDTGLQMSHPDIANSANVAPGWDMVSDPRTGNDGDGRDPDANDPGDLCDPSDPLQSDSFHGTHVAGTVGAAATNNRSGVAGGAWNVKIVPVRALGRCGGRLSDINDGIRWAGGLIPAFDDNGDEVWNDNPADIINLSIGLFEFCPASMQDAIDSVTARGVLVVSAAGNDRVSTQFYAPGGCNNVISVAASDARGNMTPYSNYGAEVDILAPGGDLTRDDDNDGRPDGVLSTKSAANCVDPVTNESVAGCFYAYEQGTSMAAPHVSAALALLKAKFPEKTAAELEGVLLGSLDPRSPTQCSGACDIYPGTPIDGSPGLCSRPCGGGLLNLANIRGDE